jgi:hypothetical protein
MDVAAAVAEGAEDQRYQADTAICWEKAVQRSEFVTPPQYPTSVDSRNCGLRLAAPAKLIMGSRADMRYDGGPETGQTGSVRVSDTWVNNPEGKGFE